MKISESLSLLDVLHLRSAHRPDQNVYTFLTEDGTEEEMVGMAQQTDGASC